MYVDLVMASLLILLFAPGPLVAVGTGPGAATGMAAVAPLTLVLVVTSEIEDDEDDEAPCTIPAATVLILVEDNPAPGPPTARTEGFRGPIGNGGRERRFGGGAGSIMGALGIIRRDGTGIMGLGDMEAGMCDEPGLRIGENSCGVSGKAAVEVVDNSRWSSGGGYERCSLEPPLLSGAVWIRRTSLSEPPRCCRRSTAVLGSLLTLPFPIGSAPRPSDVNDVVLEVSES